MDDAPSLIKLLDDYQRGRELETLPFKTWDDVKCLDDLVASPGILVEIVKEVQRRCPYLCQKEKSFLYCGKDIPENHVPKLDPHDRVVKSQQGIAELQLFCLDNFEACVYFTSKQPAPGSRPA